MIYYIDDELQDMERADTMLKIPSVGYDFVTSLCGKYLGSGVYRSVFEYALDNKYVIKVEPKNTMQNMNEWTIWNEAQHLQGNLEWVKDWFAPVKWISPNGRLLVMRKTKEISNKKKPNKVPSFLWDVKQENFGWIGNKYVCHDYGSSIYGLISYKKKFRKEEWK